MLALNRNFKCFPINKLMLLILLIAVFAIQLGCGNKLSSEEHIFEARQALQSKDITTAIIHLKNALTQEGENAEALQLLGEVYFEQKQYEDAVYKLEDAQRNGASPDEGLPLIAQSKLFLREYKELDAIKLDALKSQDAIGIISAAQGLSKLYQGFFKESEGLILQANKLSENPFVVEAKAKYYVTSDPEYSAGILQGLADKNPGYAPAFLMLGDLELQKNNVASGVDFYSIAIEVDPQGYSAYYKRALAYLSLSEMDLARSDIDKIAKGSPNNLASRYLNGLFGYLTGDYQGAIEHFSLVVNQAKVYPMSVFYLSHSHFNRGNLVQAEEYAHKYLALSPDSVEGAKLLASIKLKTGRSAAANDLLMPIVKNNPNDTQARQLLASAMLVGGDSGGALELLDGAPDDAVTNSLTHVQRGVGYLVSGDQDQGLEYIEQALAINPEYKPAGVLKVKVLMEKGSFDEALSSARQLQEHMSDDPSIQNLIAEIYVAMRQKENAVKAFEETLTIDPGNIVASESLAFISIGGGDLDSARDYYQKSLDLKGSNPSVLTKMAALEGLAGNKKLEEQYYLDTISNFPLAIEPRVNLIQRYLAENELEKASGLAAGFDKTQWERAEVLYVRGLVKLYQRDYKQAQNLMERVVSITPNAALPHYYLGLSYQGIGRLDDAYQSFNQAKTLAPNFVAPRIEAAKYEFGRNDLESARANLTLLLEIAPSNPKVLLLDAFRARLDGEANLAVARVQAAYEIAPKESNLLSLSEQLGLNGRNTEAIKALSGWLDQGNESAAVRKDLADRYLIAGDEPNALAQYQRAIELNPSDAVVLNNLAWLIKDKDVDQAIKYAKSAQQLDGKLAQVEDTLAMLWLQKGDIVRSLSHIQKAAEMSSDLTIKYHKALINHEAGNNEMAVTLLDEILKTDANFSGKSKAEELFQNLQ